MLVYRLGTYNEISQLKTSKNVTSYNSKWILKSLSNVTGIKKKHNTCDKKYKINAIKSTIK